MREKLTVIKVGGKIVEEEATLLQLLNDCLLYTSDAADD